MSEEMAQVTVGSSGASMVPARDLKNEVLRL